MRFIPIATIFAMVFLVSGCAMFPFGSNSEPDVVTFLGGEEGLDISFVGNNPPPRVFQNRNFNVILKLENHGEQNIAAEEIRVLLSNSKTFGYENLPVQNNSEILTKRLSTETGFIPGGIEYISFYDLSYSGSTMLTEDSPVSIAVDVCYPYKTTAVADICVSREAAESDICDPIGTPSIDSTSGPLEVTKLNQLYNGKVSFAEENNDVSVGVRIEFDIIGDGDLYGIQTDCNTLSNNAHNVITVDKITIGNETYLEDQIIDRCSSNELELSDDDGTGFINCDFVVEGVTYDFEERFTITLSYLHSQLLTKKISVMPVLESMKKCITSDECNSKDDPDTWKMYCEQPGFCRTKIPSGVECGLPMDSENTAITCADGECLDYDIGISGICASPIEEFELCQKSSDCVDGAYCLAIVSSDMGICVPKIPNNYPCKTPFNDVHDGWSCESGVCSKESGLCTLDQSKYGAAE
jgi:hypothetical protein